MATAEKTSQKLLTIQGTARFLSCGVYTVRKLIWARQLPVVTLPGGKKQWVAIEDLEKFITANKATV